MGDLRRRDILHGRAAAGATGRGLLSSSPHLFGERVVNDIRELKRGEFTWHPERSPEGPVASVVSIPDQRVHVHRNGVRIGASTCSTGAPGRATRTGMLTILEKDKHHHSSTYNNAPMPNMNRLTFCRQGVRGLFKLAALTGGRAPHRARETAAALAPV
ncbi:MAG: L,D-transpeptidase family protein [Hyphomicrobiaceae bacterium]